MTPLLIYFIKANLALALLYICYRLLFQHDTFFKLRRFALLSIYLVAFLYQLPDISTWLSTHGSVSEVVAYYYSVITPVNPDSQEPLVYATDRTDTILIILHYIYPAGVFLLIFRCLAELCSIIASYHNNNKIEISGKQVCLLKENEGAYSFLNWIFIPAKITHQEGFQEILLHEIAHVHQRHSLDVLMGEIITIICWMNPFAWLLKKEITINHEYLADQQVMNAGYNKKEYQYHLIGMGHQSMAAAKLYNNFSVLPLKKRITMLNKKRTNSVRKVKYLALIPMAAGLLLLNNIDAMARIISRSAIVPAPAAMAVGGNTESSTPVNADKDKVYDLTNNEKVDKEPMFPGGENKLMHYICNSVKYPAEAQTKGEQGKVWISFIIEKNGKLSNFVIQEKLTKLLDAEALRVLKAMPDWTPAEKNGEKVRSKINVPITFRLQ